MRRYYRDGEYTHLVDCLNNEYTLCGDAYDIAETDCAPREYDPELHDKQAVSRGPVTCPQCIEVIEWCRGVKVRKAGEK